jgi:hypothetical protein
MPSYEVLQVDRTVGWLQLYVRILKKTQWLLAREQTIPTERLHVVSAADPYGRIPGFLYGDE